MTREDLNKLIENSKIFQHWHWFKFHFERSLKGGGHPLAESVAEACIACESKVPGFAKKVIERLAAVGGRDRHLPDWEQLLQQLAELHIVFRVLSWNWPGGTRFDVEPSTEESKKNPELVVSTSHARYGFEVKAPALFAHAENRSKNPTQIASRFAPKETLDEIFKQSSSVTLPRDNPIKDFLLSAEAKFEPFHRRDKNFFGILVIVWDDFVYEPISALLQPDSGLLTQNSYFKDEKGSAIQFPSISGVVIVRHLHQLYRACRDEPLIDGCRGPLDFGKESDFPWKICIQNPGGPLVPPEIFKVLDSRVPSAELGAEYLPQEYIMWVDSK